MRRLILFLAVLIFASFGYATTYNVSACQNLNESGATYTLNQSVSIAGAKERLRNIEMFKHMRGK